MEDGAGMRDSTDMTEPMDTAGVRSDPSARLRYLPIAEHGVIGDLHTVALVGSDGTVDWYCSPRFDSPSIFASILDSERGGHYRIAPEAGAATTPDPARKSKGWRRHVREAKARQRGSRA